MQVEALLAQALNAGISNMPEPIDAVCPTARCTLEPYESVAMCAKVADVTSRLKVSTVRPEGDDADTPSGIPRGMHNATLVHMGTSGDGQPAPVRYVSLPNNVTFDHNYPFGVFSAVGNGSLAFRDDEAYDTALVHLYIIHTRSDDQRGSPDDLEPLEPPGSFPDPVEFGAFEVMLHFCVNEYETVVEEGRSRTSIRRTKGISLGSGGGGGGETGPAYAPPPPGGKWNMTATPVDRIPSVECITQPWDRSGLSGCFKNNYTGSVILASVNSDRREDGLRIDVSPQLEEMGHVIASTAAGLYMRLLTPQGYMSTAYRNRWSRRLRESLYGKERNITDPEEQAKRLEIFWGGVATSISNV